MATLYATIAAVQLSPVLGTRNNPTYERGQLMFSHAKYTMLGTEAANDILNLIKLPAGAIIIPHLSQLAHSGTLATTATATIGDDDLLGVGAAVDDDRYSTALNIAASGVDAFTGGAADLNPYILAGRSASEQAAWIQLKFATLVTPVAGTVLNARIAWVLTN